MIRLVPNDSRCGACGADANGSRLCWRCQAQQDVTDANRHGSLPDPTPDDEADEAAAEQARLDLASDQPQDRAVATFREEIAAHGDPQLATVKALDAWLFRQGKRGES